MIERTINNISKKNWHLFETIISIFCQIYFVVPIVIHVMFKNNRTQFQSKLSRFESCVANFKAPLQMVGFFGPQYWAYRAPA